MDRQNPTHETQRCKNGVVAALELCERSVGNENFQNFDEQTIWRRRFLNRINNFGYPFQRAL